MIKMININITKLIICILLASHSFVSYGHDTTHIHPLITSEIRKLIKLDDTTDSAYLDIYELDPNPVEGALPQDQFLYWGTDFDPSEINGENDLTDYLVNDQESPYLTAILAAPKKKNTITGVVYEDYPFVKVINHFYQAEAGEGMFPGDKSSNTAMLFFNEAVQAMGGYTEESKQEAFFLFGQALHHVQDMIIPAHIHNNAENALFVPMRRYGQLKNTHVTNSTLRFLNCPCLTLKQTERFQLLKSKYNLS